MHPMALGQLGLGAGPNRYLMAPRPPVGIERTMPGFPYGMAGLGYPPAPIPEGMPAQSYFQAPPYFTHTYGYKDALAAAGLEFHTEVFDLAIDVRAQNAANIAPGATAIATVRISQEADFVAEKVMDFCSDTANLLTPETVGYRVQVFDNATNRALSNIPLPRSVFAGTAQRPALMKPRLFRRNSDLTFVVTADPTNANAINRLVIMIRGFKIFDPNSLNLNNPQ